MLKSGIIGLGVGLEHIAGYSAHPHCQVDAICDFSEEKLLKIKEKHPHLKTYTDARYILEDPKIELVSICSYDQFHAEHVIAALKNGKHVFVEKPLCISESEAEKIRAITLESPSLTVSSNLILRKYPRFTFLKNQVEAGKFGQLYYADVDYNYGRLEKITQGWRGDLPGYSVILGGGVHLIDFLLWITNDEVLEVCAFGNNLCTQGTKFKENDLVVALLKFRSGFIAKLSANFGCVQPHFHQVSIYGTHATFINGYDHGLLYTSRNLNDPPEILKTPYPGVEKGALIYNFVESILTNKACEVGTEDIFKCLSVCFAINKAVQTGSHVKVEYL